MVIFGVSRIAYRVSVSRIDVSRIVRVSRIGVSCAYRVLRVSRIVAYRAYRVCSFLASPCRADPLTHGSPHRIFSLLTGVCFLVHRFGRLSMLTPPSIFNNCYKLLVPSTSNYT